MNNKIKKIILENSENKEFGCIHCQEESELCITNITLLADEIEKRFENAHRERVYVGVHGEGRDENAFLEACKPLMKYMCENYHPHVTVIIDGTRAELVEGLKTVKCDDYIRD